jgi:hypothetical protein
MTMLTIIIVVNVIVRDLIDAISTLIVGIVGTWIATDKI